MRKIINHEGYHPKNAKENASGGKSPGPSSCQINEIFENAVPVKEIPLKNSPIATDDKLHWIGVSEDKFYRILDSRNGQYHIHEMPWEKIPEYAKQLFKKTG